MGALTGIKVLDFSRILAGPFATMLLGDFGAEVVKIERPDGGDDTRHWGPPFAGELSAYYLSINRNKKSITLNLKTAEGIELARQLALQSDILIENFKVGQMAEYRLDYATLREIHPRLIYCSLTGYGQYGDYAARPGYDYVIQAQSGLMSITGETNGEPMKVGVAISDVLTGLYAANAIQTALIHREHTGQGQYIDLALFDSQLAALVNVASNMLVSGVTPQRYGNAHPNIVPYEAFHAADGQLVVAVGNDSQFRALCQIMGRIEWADDDRFETNPARVQNREILIPMLQQIFLQRTVEIWMTYLLEKGIPCGEINTIQTALHLSHTQQRRLIQPVTLGDGRIVEVVNTPAQLSETPATIRFPPPILGQDTEEVLSTWLGLDANTLADYRVREII